MNQNYKQYQKMLNASKQHPDKVVAVDEKDNVILASSYKELVALINKRGYKNLCISSGQKKYKHYLY